MKNRVSSVMCNVLMSTLSLLAPGVPGGPTIHPLTGPGSPRDSQLGPSLMT